MEERELRSMIASVRAGTMSRRHFVNAMIGLGLTAPMAAQMLASAGVAQAQTKTAYKPTKRGGGGPLKTLWWQGPTLLNPHFATGTKDQDGSRIFYEPLAGWDNDGNLIPVLAAEVPTPENGGLAADAMSVTWKLKRNVQWHDGKPFTSADVVFNWEYASDPATAAVTIGSYKDIKVQAIDAYTVRVEYTKPSPFWADPFVSVRGMIIPKHLFEAYKGAKSREAPNNLKPVGTGPYKFVDFRPGDTVRGEINRDYHEPNRPHFDAIEMKGGGDAVSAARAVLQTGEFDYAWNIQVEDEILKRMEQGGKGRMVLALGSAVEHVIVNFSDPWTEVDGERSNAKTHHPTLSDPAVREALNLLADRGAIQQHVYGRAGVATRNYLNGPERFRSPNTKWEFSIDKANQVLEAAGWKRGADGIRAKDGRKLKFVYQTSTNAPRQKTQQIIKQACQKAGIDVELKSIPASVFFSSDVSNFDTSGHFYADLEMLALGGEPDPWVFMNPFCSWEAASKANKWQGRNLGRWRNDEYDEIYRAAARELDPVKRAALFIRMNELIVENRAAIPLVNRPEIGAASHKLQMTLSAWDTHLWLLQDWYRDG